VATHTVKSSTGKSFEVVVGEDGRITDGIGAGRRPERCSSSWAPARASPALPAELVARAQARQADVCFCDDNGHMIASASADRAMK
jgi:hypothetical protein